MNESQIKQAEKYHENGKIKALHKLIKPFLKQDDPYAWLFYSTYSLPKWKETDEEFDSRTIKSLHKALDGNIPRAMYQLSLFYLVGDCVEKNPKTGADLLERAVALNYSPAKLSYGLYLYYGGFDIPQDQARGKALLEAAAAEGIEDADNALVQIMKEEAEDAEEAAAAKHETENRETDS